MRRAQAWTRPAARVSRWAVPALFAIAAVSTGVHTAASLDHASAQPSTRAWLVALFGVLRTSVALAFAVLTVGRAAPKRRTRSPLAFLACAMAVVIAFGAPSRNTPEALLVAGELVAVAFCVWLLVSVVVLGRCFGVLPEARGLVTRGPYRLVRHPVYLGEIGACAGLTIAASSLLNTALLAILILAQTVRMRLEEEALTQAFPEYVRYAAHTPRLIPRLRLPRMARAFARPHISAQHHRIAERRQPVRIEPAQRR